MARNVCATCGDDFIGRTGASFCSPTCRQRAHRSKKTNNRDNSVTVTAPAAGKRPRARPRPPVPPAGHTAEALALLASLENELAENSAALGLPADEPLGWSAAERAILDMVADAVDRKVDLWARYHASDEDKLRVKLSGELRLLESNIARLLKQVDTDLPASEPESHSTVRARNASNARWDRERRRGSR